MIYIKCVFTLWGELRFYFVGRMNQLFWRHFLEINVSQFLLRIIDYEYKLTSKHTRSYTVRTVV